MGQVTCFGAPAQARAQARARALNPACCTDGKGLVGLGRLGLAICRFKKNDYTAHFGPLIIDLNRFWPWIMMREAIGLDLAL